MGAGLMVVCILAGVGYWLADLYFPVIMKPVMARAMAKLVGWITGFFFLYIYVKGMV